MKIRNFIPLTLFLILTAPPGFLFLFVWQGHAFVIGGMQIFQMLLLFLAYKAGVNSAQKNFQPRLELGKIIFLPLKVNFALYLVVGLPLVLFYAGNLTVLQVAYGISLLGFTLTYLSGLTYVVRSA